METFTKQLLFLSIWMIMLIGMTFAQPERVGQAGALELLINSYPRSSGVNGIDVGSSSGIESTIINPGGLATTKGTELIFAHTFWLMGSDIGINSFGLSQGLGVNAGTVGVAVTAFDLGDFVRTTVDQPDGTLGTFSPTMLNIGVSYARKFTDRIYVGATIRIIHNSTPEVTANGFAFDAGVQYRAGKDDRTKLGISLRNVGPSMTFTGDGLSQRVLLQNTNDFTTTINVPAAEFELPAVLSMGISHDFFLGQHNTITILGAFISNAFYFDQFGLGLAYKYREYVILRGSFLYENGIFGDIFEDRYSAYTGASMGATFQIPFKTGKKDIEGNMIFSKFSLDLSYRTTSPFSGTLVLGARIDL